MHFKQISAFLGIFASLMFPPQKALSENSSQESTLKTIVVDRDVRPQRVYLVEGNNDYPFARIVGFSKASTGKPGLRTDWPSDYTPLGFYYVVSKNKNAKNTSRGWDMPFALWYTNASGTPEGINGLHAYENTNFGEPASHGCVRLPHEFAESAFEWADINTPIIIIGNQNLNHADKERFDKNEYEITKKIINKLEENVAPEEIKELEQSRDLLIKMRNRPFLKNIEFLAKEE